MVTTAELQLFKDARFDIYRNMSNFNSLSEQNSYYNSLDKLDYDIVFNKIGDPFTLDLDIATLSEYTTGRINYAGIWWYFQVLDLAVNAQGQTTLTYQLNAWESHRYQGNVRLGAGQIERKGSDFDYMNDAWNPMVESARYWRIEDATDRDNSTVVLGTNSAPCILAMYRDNDNDWIYPVCLKLVKDDSNYILTNTSAFAHYIIDAMTNVFENGELLGMWYSSFYPNYTGPWTATGVNRVYYYNIMDTSERDINDMRISLIFNPETIHQQGYVHNTETEQYYIADERGNIVYRMADGCLYNNHARMVLNMSLTSCQWIGTLEYQNESDDTYCTDYFEIACEPLDFYNDSWAIYQSQQRQTDIDARSLNTQSQTVSSLTGIGTSALGGAVVGSVVPGIGTAVGAVAGLIAGTVGTLATTLYDYGYANNKEQEIIDSSYKKASDNISYQGNGVNGAMLFWSNDCNRTGFWASCGAGLKKRMMDRYTANLIANDESVYGCYVNIITDDVDSEIEDGPFLAYCEVLGIPAQWAGQIQERLSNGVLFSTGRARLLSREPVQPKVARGDNMYDDGDFWSVKEESKKSKSFEGRYAKLYKAKMERLARNMFKWTCNETHVTGDLIERYLWQDGKALVWNHPMLGWIVTRCAETGWNVNGYANAWKPIPDHDVPGIAFPQEVTDDDAVCIYEWSERYINRKACLFLADEMADVNETIRQQVWNQKTPLLAITGTTQKRDKIRNMIVRIAQNINVLFMDKDIADDIKPLDLNAPFNVIELHQHKKYIENEMLDWLGIDQQDANPKKERMIVDEQEANDESLNYTLADMLNERLRACDKLSEMGVNITVEVQRSVRPEDDSMDGDPEQPDDNTMTYQGGGYNAD